MTSMRAHEHRTVRRPWTRGRSHWTAALFVSLVLTGLSVTPRADEGGQGGEGTVIRLNSGSLHTTPLKKDSTTGGAGDFTGRRLHLLQFSGPVRQDWYAALEGTGARLVTYIPDNAYLVYADATALRRIEGLGRESTAVKW